MNFNPEKYSTFLKVVLTPPGYQHSLGVMKVMGELSAIYQLDHAQAMMAGLLHDVARDFSPQQLLAFAGEEAALLQSGWLVEYFDEQGIPVHPNLMKSSKHCLPSLA